MIVKVNCPPSEYVTEIQRMDSSKRIVKGSVDDLSKNVEAILAIKMSGVWFMSGCFGVSFQAHKILVVKSIEKMKFTDHFILEKEYIEE